MWHKGVVTSTPLFIDVAGSACFFLLLFLKDMVNYYGWMNSAVNQTSSLENAQYLLQHSKFKITWVMQEENYAKHANKCFSKWLNRQINKAKTDKIWNGKDHFHSTDSFKYLLEVIFHWNHSISDHKTGSNLRHQDFHLVFLKSFENLSSSLFQFCWLALQ